MQPKKQRSITAETSTAENHPALPLLPKRAKAAASLSKGLPHEGHFPGPGGAVRPVVKENEPLLSIKFNDFIHFFQTDLYGIADVYAAVHHSQSHDLPGSRRRCLQKNRGRLSKNGPGNVPFSVPLGRAAKPCFAATPAAPVRHGLSTRSSLRRFSP